MNDTTTLQAVIHHVTYYHGLADTILAVAVSPRLRVTLRPIDGRDIDLGVQRIVDWGRSIGASEVERHHSEGRIVASGHLRCGTAVSVEILTRVHRAEPESIRLDQLGEVAS